jgi:hypothetical protein
MIGALFDLIGGWREVRSSQGFSYQVARNGKRRIVPIEGYKKVGLADQQWIESGRFADDALSERFRDFAYRAPKQPKRKRLAKVDFALNH